MNSRQAPTSQAACNFCGARDAVEIIPSTLTDGRPSGPYNPFACTSSGYGEHGSIVRCRHCGLIYAAPRPETRDVLELYASVQDTLYVTERAGRIATFEHHLKPLERFTGPPADRRLLDVGAYTGVFVEIAAQHGWDAWGVEPSAWAVREAQRDGLQMILGTLESSSLPDASYAVVTMWDVIEHVADPLTTLRTAWRVLEPGGSLVVHTMDLGSPFAKLMGHHWPWFMEMHLYYFTRKTLRAMLEKAGFTVIWMGAQGRTLQAGYLISRISALLPPLGRPLAWAVDKAGLSHVPLRINLGDLFTAYARKPRT